MEVADNPLAQRQRAVVDPCDQPRSESLVVSVIGASIDDPSI
jgi:hypothetical protein